MNASSKLPRPDEEALQELASHLAALSQTGTIRQLLNELLTPAERVDLARRWRLMRLLTQGVPQRHIARALKVSLCKITRGSSVLKGPDSVCSRLLTVDKTSGGSPR